MPSPNHSPNGEALVELFPLPDRHHFIARDVVEEIWIGLGLPSAALASLHLPGDGETPALPSSYKIGILAQGTIALSALAAAQVHALRQDSEVPEVEVSQEHAVIEFSSEKLYTIDGHPTPSSWGQIGGLHKTSDGYVRVHASFPNHANGVLELVGLPHSATREELSMKLANWTSEDVENASVAKGTMVAYKLRTYQQWDGLIQSKAINNFPIDISRVQESKIKTLPTNPSTERRKCLDGLRVIEMSRVIAAPVAGKTLAAHGADVIWVTSPNLPDLPGLDRDLGRGKRTVQLDIRRTNDKNRLLELLRTADVFIQSYRPSSLASHNLSAEELVKINPNLVIANLSAFGPRGPWCGRRGFDSLVQTCSGMNVSEAEHAGKGEAARPMPCQALDHAAGYLLATGVMAGVYRRTTEGGSWKVDVSLAGAMKYLRSLGQYPGDSGFEAKIYKAPYDVLDSYYETRPSSFGSLRAIKHSAIIKGVEVGWDIMPKPLGSDNAEWLN